MPTSRYLSQLSSREVFEEEEFAAASRIERILMHCIEPHRHMLTDLEEAYLTQVRKCWHIYTSTQHEGLRYMRLMDAFPNMTDESIDIIKRDMQFIYGDFSEVDRDFQRAVDRKMLHRLIDNAEAEGEYGAVATLTKSLLALNGTDRPRGENAKPNQKMLPDVIFLSDDITLIDGPADEEE